MGSEKIMERSGAQSARLYRSEIVMCGFGGAKKRNWKEFVVTRVDERFIEACGFQGYDLGEL
jgi:hypothetical protein